MKIIKKVIAVVLIAALMIINIPMDTYAASGSSSISVSSSSVKMGGTVTVTVSVNSSTSIGASIVNVSYSSGILEYTGCSGATAGGGGGAVRLVWNGSESTKSASATLTFKAVSTGTASVSLSNTDSIDWNGKAISISGSSASVSVIANTSDTNNNANTNNNNGNDSNSATTEEQNKETTANCNLSSLQISPGSLSPKFKPGTTKYSATVEEDITSLVISASSDDSTAKVSVSGNKNLQAGNNKVTITVTATNGEAKTYVINVNRGGEPETTEEEEGAATVDIDGTLYTFATSAEGLTIPEGFTESEGTYGEAKVLAFASPNSLLKVVCLFDQEETGAQYWYLLNEESGSLLPYIEYLANANRYVVLDKPEDVIIPEGFTQVDFDLDGSKIHAYTDGNENSFVLVYATTVYGEASFYWYDSDEGTFQRYISPTVEEEVIEPEVVDDITDNGDSNGGLIKGINIITIVAIALSIIFFIMVLVLCIQLRDKRVAMFVDKNSEKNEDTKVSEQEIPTISFDDEELAATSETTAEDISEPVETLYDPFDDMNK